MPRSTDSILRLLKAGGNLNVNAEGKQIEELLRIVKLSAANKKQLTMTKLENHTTDSILRIVKAGGDYLTIEV